MLETLNWISSLFSAVSTVCFFIGSLGGSDEDSLVYKANWFYVDSNGFSLYANFWKVIQENSDGKVVRTYYIDSDCSYQFCDSCAGSGVIVFPLIVVATVAAFVTFAVAFIGAHYPSLVLSWRGLFFSAVSTFCGLVGWGAFMNQCYLEFEDTFKEDSNYGPGSIVSLVGFLLMFFTMVMELTCVILGRIAYSKEQAQVFVEPDPDPEESQ